MSGKAKKDAYFIGMWKDDVVTDNIIKEVVTRSSVDKGRRVKLRLTPEGLLVSKTSVFQVSSKIDSIPIGSIYFMTVNKHSPNCLLCIIRDTVRKYNVLAFRCLTALDAGDIVKTFKGLRGDGMRMMKRDDGNWTLRAPSAKTIPRQTLDILVNNPSNGIQPNGEALHEYCPPEHRIIDPVTEEVESVTKGEELVLKGKSLQNIGVQTHFHDDGDTMSEISDVSSFKEELDYLSQELREVKYLLEKSTGISAEEHLRLAKQVDSATDNNVFDKSHMHVESNNNTIYTDNHGVAHAMVPDYRNFGVQTTPHSRGRHTHVHCSNNVATSAMAAVLRHETRQPKVDNQSRSFSNASKRHELRAVVNGRVVSVPVTQPLQVHTGSARVVHTLPTAHYDRGNSLHLKYDRPPSSTPTDEKSRSLRLKHASSVGVPTSIERPIEYTYSARIREPYAVGHPLVSRKVRPKSMYIISGGKPLTVHNPTRRQDWATKNFEAPI